jgi:hypothetical protein
MSIQTQTRKLLALLVFSVMSFSVASEEERTKTIWSCKKPFGSENILWLVEWGPKSYIKVFDQRIPAQYSLDGLEKRWDWGLDSSDFTYDYAITLEPDLTAQYYDFRAAEGGRAKAKEIYKCSK